MPRKMIPMSVRISDEDAAFLATRAMPGAATPSDKIRMILKEARMRHDGGGDYATGLAYVQLQMDPLVTAVREAEGETGKHSELVVNFLHWLEESLAFAIANGRPMEEGEAKGRRKQLRELEAGLADRIAILMETVLRLAILPKNPCYDPTAVTRRLDSVLELADLINQTRPERG